MQTADNTLRVTSDFTNNQDLNKRTPMTINNNFEDSFANYKVILGSSNLQKHKSRGAKLSNKLRQLTFQPQAIDQNTQRMEMLSNKGIEDFLLSKEFHQCK
jgi:hypothetical protein